MRKTLLLLVAALTFTTLAPAHAETTTKPNPPGTVSTATWPPVLDPCLGCGVAMPLGPVLQAVAAPAVPNTVTALPAQPSQGLSLPGWLLTGAVSILCVALAGAAPALQQFLRSRAGLVKTQEYRELLLVIADLAYQKVHEFQAAVVEQLKAAAADGKLTQEEIDGIRRTVSREIWEALAPHQKDVLLAAHGTADIAQRLVIEPALAAPVNNLSSGLSALEGMTGISVKKDPARYEQAVRRIAPRTASF